jgi:class 3 adenylate cyclase
VVVDQVGSGSRHEQLALGETPNLAARLQALAEPDRVVISAATYRLVDGFFRCRDLGLQSLKGVAEPLRAFEVVEEGPARFRLEVAAPASPAPPLVSREQEIGLLRPTDSKLQ